MKIPHIVWKAFMKNADGEETRYIVWAESQLGAALEVQKLRKEQDLELYSSYFVCSLKDKGYGPVEMACDVQSYSHLDAVNDVFEDLFKNPTLVNL